MVLPARRHDERGRRGLRGLRGDGFGGGLAGRPGPQDEAPAGWLITAYFGLYGLAILMILGRHLLPRSVRGGLRPLCLANVLLAVMAGADAAHFAEMKAHGHGEGDSSNPPSLDDHQPAVGLGKPINRTLWALIWSVAAVIFQAMGITYILGGEILLPPVHPQRASTIVAGPTTFFVGATLAFIAMLRWRRFFANGLVGWSIVNLFLLYLRLEHDRLRLPGHRHQAGQRADRRLADPGRLLHLAAPCAAR